MCKLPSLPAATALSTALSTAVLGAIPPLIPGLPVVSMLQNSPCTIAAVASSATLSWSPGAPITQSVTQDAPNSALSWFLSSLVLDLTLHAQGNRLSLGPGLPTVPKPLMEKIQQWEYVDLAELLPSCNSQEVSA